MPIDWVNSIPLGALGLAGLTYVYKTLRTHDVTRVFVRDMATNHLPHIYSGMEDIADSLGVKLKDPPPIKFISEKDFKQEG